MELIFTCESCQLTKPYSTFAWEPIYQGDVMTILCHSCYTQLQRENKLKIIRYMNIETYKTTYINSNLLPKASDVIDLKQLHTLTFFNTSYREYLTVYQDWIIGLYHFSVTIEKALTLYNKPLTYKEYKILGVRSQLHHSHFNDELINTDPCDIYEKVSGIKIHNKESDNHMMNKDHTNDIKLFEAHIISLNRNNKLNQIL